MIRQFLRLLIQRNFKRNSFYTIINILGLSVGLTVFILFTLFINEVNNYDSFHENYNNIYRIVCEADDSRGDFAGTPAQLGSYLSERIPEIENFVRYDQKTDIVVKKNDESYFESDLLYADNSFFEIFSFPIIYGNKNNPIEDISSVVISEKMSNKFFGGEEPIGQYLKIGRSERDYRVTAVIKDCPKNSSIKYDFIVSFEKKEKKSHWGMFNFRTFIQLNSSGDFNKVEQKIKDCAVERSEDEFMKLNFLRLQPLKDMRFEIVRGNMFNTIDNKYILIFLSATVFILLLATINYTNLSTAISLGRYKEVAVKKVFGCNRKRIIFELLTESISFALIAFIIAFILVELTRPIFGNLINEKIRLSFSYIPFFTLITVMIGVLAGLYPSFYISRFKIMELLKKTTKKGRRVFAIRNFLIIIQFGITSFLLVCALIFSNQLNYLFKNDLGLETKNIVEVQIHWPGLKLNEFKNELKQFAGIENLSTSSFMAGKDGWSQSAYWKDMFDDQQINMFIIKVDKDYFKTLGIKFNEILPDFDNLNFRDDEYYVINKSAKDYIGWDVALEKEFSIFHNSFGQIAAVVNDFNFRSLHYETSPTAILVSEKPVADRMHIRIKQGYENEARLFINKKWKEFAPDGAPLLITDLQQDFQNLYTTEKKTRIIVILFTLIALFISMLGLIGLATFIAAQRTKEIGIRKVLGASSQRISKMLILGFVKWVFIAFVISVPLAYVYLNNWLNHFAYHINVGVGVFVITALFIFIIAVASVYIQSIRTASQNPINSLRYE